MFTLNACTCPRCHYFFGYSTTQPGFSNRRTTLIGSCLNCDYQLPFHALLRGRRTSPAVQRTTVSRLKLVPGKLPSFAPVALAPRHRGSATAPSSAACQCYGRDLRAVGQALEKLQLKNFTLKRAGQSYFIWARDPAQANPSSQRTFESFRKRTTPIAPTFRLDPDDLERIEHAGKVRRQKTYSVTNGHNLSHLLRTLGEHINSRGQRLLGITWREQSVSVVIETATGRRRVDELPTDYLYDLWVRMYLRRAH
jgi:hypothetical protein